MVERRYPDLTFDLSAEAFECPACRDYCNCSLCARKRGEAYVSERSGGGWRSWVARQGGSHRAATAAVPTSASKSKSRDPGTAPKQPATMTMTTADTQVFDRSGSATAVFTVSGEPLGSAFLHVNKARIVPDPQATVSPSAAATTTVATSSIPKPAQKEQQQQQQLQRRRYVFIGKLLKAWGRLVSLPDPEHDQPKGTKGKGKRTAMAHGRRRCKRIRLFVGSLEPLLVAGRRRKNKNRRRRSASLPPLSASDDGNEDGNVGDVDVDADADVDTDDDDDDGVWPGEYEVPVPPIPTIVVTGPVEAEAEVARITPEEVERAIGAAFAIGSAT